MRTTSDTIARPTITRNVCKKIRDNFDKPTDIIRDMYTKPSKLHRDSGYQELYDAIMMQFMKDEGIKQIKILSVTASPGDDLKYEQEQDTLLHAFQGFDRERVFLDMPDPVQDTLTEIEEHLRDGQHDILHITAHGSLAGKHGVLFLETEGGKEVQITGAVL